MNAERVPLEALKERSRICFGRAAPLVHAERSWALTRTHLSDFKIKSERWCPKEYPDYATILVDLVS